MVNTRSENPELITPNFSRRVTPPRNPNPSVVDQSFDASNFQSAENSFYSMAGENQTNTPPIPEDRNQIPFPSTSTPQSTQDTPQGNSTQPTGAANDDDNKSLPPPPPRSLEQIIAAELEKSGLSGIDDSLLKVLLIRNLSRSAIDSEQDQTSSPRSLVSDHLKWHQLGKDLAPQLSMDGSNFPMWSASLLDVVKRVTGVDKYFDLDRSGADSGTAAGVLTLVQQSIDPVLRLSLNGLNAYGAYVSLKKRFAATSWSLLLNRWSDIAQAPDASDTISASYEALKRSWYDLEERLGGLTTDKLLSLSFHSVVKRYHQGMADSMDARIAIKPDHVVTSEELLHMATRLHQSASASGSASAMAISSQPSRPPQQQFTRGGRGRGNYRHSRGSGRQSNQSSRPQSNPTVPPPDNWARQYLTPDFPCNMCWEWGHWAPDCPRVKDNLPPLDDPRKNDPSWKPKKSNTLSGRIFKSGELASVSATPENSDDPLCDTGATNHTAFP
ncbi:hypothetical protein PGTUg99_050263 [Puccinia graminis f. sp. tritici]|uniref:CCHC-type domain-containing protein n=1 Tax=Puccinia graminis f. sp. tritici TaxID=56615 RepID=A0A5B0SD80_PUCGR|nr:hypothetical protein PGTUg99_050263 [Puccinia graminis f. sp. tritici]